MARAERRYPVDARRHAAGRSVVAFPRPPAPPSRPAVSAKAKAKPIVVAKQRRPISQRRASGAQQPFGRCSSPASPSRSTAKLRRVVMTRAHAILPEVDHQAHRVQHDDERERARHRSHRPQEPALMLLARALGHALEEPRLHLAPPPLPRLEGAAVLLRRVASHRAPCPSPGAHAGRASQSRQRLKDAEVASPRAGRFSASDLAGVCGSEEQLESPYGSWAILAN